LTFIGCARTLEAGYMLDTCVGEMKLLHEPIAVQTRKGWPVRLQRGESIVQVRDVLRVWVHQTGWWKVEERREYFMLHTDAGVVVIYRKDGEWMLARSMD
jgi:hypothetical protein